MPISRNVLEDVASWADAWLEYRQRTLGLPGVQFAIAHEGVIVGEGSHGLADLATGEPLRKEHLFRIASHSKTFTATAVLQLAEADERVVRLDDLLSAHLPQLRARPELADLANLTVGDLLHHGSGISRDGIDGDYWQLQRKFPDADELLNLKGE